jgi:hypothetical protein
MLIDRPSVTPSNLSRPGGHSFGATGVLTLPTARRGNQRSAVRVRPDMAPLYAAARRLRRRLAVRWRLRAGAGACAGPGTCAAAADGAARTSQFVTGERMDGAAGTSAPSSQGDRWSPRLGATEGGPRKRARGGCDAAVRRRCTRAG